MDGPGTYSQPPYAGGSKDESGTAAKDTISIGSGDRVSGEDRMGMEVHYSKGQQDLTLVKVKQLYMPMKLRQTYCLWMKQRDEGLH